MSIDSTVLDLESIDGISNGDIVVRFSHLQDGAGCLQLPIRWRRKSLHLDRGEGVADARVEVEEMQWSAPTRCSTRAKLIKTRITSKLAESQS